MPALSLDQYAVIGNPIAHSKSPDIHALFAAQTGRPLQYDRLLSPLDAFASTVDAFRRAGGMGVNVTVPFKLEAFALVEQHGRITERAELAGAVNTIGWDGQEMWGDNTDGAGLVRDIIYNCDTPLAGMRILLLGAGGAARGALGPLLAEEPERLVIANRTFEKAEQLTRRIAGLAGATTLSATAFTDLTGQSFDVVINATSSSLTDTQLVLPPGLFSADALAYDMMYGTLTPFMSQALELEAAFISDGLGMLVEQAAEAFCLWHGLRPETESVLMQLREQQDQA